MPKTLPLTDTSAAELLTAAKSFGAVVLSGPLRNEIVAALAEPVVPAAGGQIPASLPGYTRVFSREYVWGVPMYPPLETVGWDGKSIAIIGVTVPPGSSGQVTFVLTEQDGRPGVWGTEREVCISRTPGAFETDIPSGYVKGFNVGRAITADGPQRALTYLPPGRYFISARWSEASDARMKL